MAIPVRRRRKYLRRLVAAFGIPVALPLFACVIVGREIHQDALDRELIAAVSGNKTAIAVALLNAGANSNARRSTTAPPTPLQILTALLHGKRPLPPASYGASALSIAVQRDNTEVVRALLAHRATGVNDLVDVTGPYGELAPEPLLFRAVESGNVAIAAMLLERGALTRDAGNPAVGVLPRAFAPLDDSDPEQAPVHLHQKMETVRTMLKMLVDRGANVQAEGFEGETALDLAAQFDDSSSVEFLLLHGAAPDGGKGHDGPLNYALGNGNTSMARTLIRHGASVKSDRHEALSISAFDVEALQFAVEHGVGVDEFAVYGKRAGETRLELAAIGGDCAIMRLLLRYGANVNFSDDGGYTALMGAAEYSTPAAIRLLLAHGARINAHSTGNGTLQMSALMFAAGEGNDENIDCLLRHGANPDLRDGDGETALMLAVEDGNDAAVQDLLEGGAKVNLVDKNGQAALDKADGNTPVIALLKRWGARPGAAAGKSGQAVAGGSK